MNDIKNSLYILTWTSCFYDEYLKNINKHQTCVVDQFKCEKIGIQKECEKMLMEEQNKSNTLLQTISNRDNSIEKLKNDQYEVRIRIIL